MILQLKHRGFPVAFAHQKILVKRRQTKVSPSGKPAPVGKHDSAESFVISLLNGMIVSCRHPAGRVVVDNYVLPVGRDVNVGFDPEIRPVSGGNKCRH